MSNQQIFKKSNVKILDRNSNEWLHEIENKTNYITENNYIGYDATIKAALTSIYQALTLYIKTYFDKTLKVNIHSFELLLKSLKLEYMSQDGWPVFLEGLMSKQAAAFLSKASDVIPVSKQNELQFVKVVYRRNESKAPELKMLMDFISIYLLNNIKALEKLGGASDDVALHLIPQNNHILPYRYKIKGIRLNQKWPSIYDVRNLALITSIYLNNNKVLTPYNFNWNAAWDAQKFKFIENVQYIQTAARIESLGAGERRLIINDWMFGNGSICGYNITITRLGYVGYKSDPKRLIQKLNVVSIFEQNKKLNCHILPTLKLIEEQAAKNKINYYPKYKLEESIARLFPEYDAKEVIEHAVNNGRWTIIGSNIKFTQNDGAQSDVLMAGHQEM